MVGNTNSMGKGQTLITETTTVSVSASTDYFYINAKTGYHLISAMFTRNFAGNQDIIIGIVWTGNNYACFLKGTDANARNMSILLTWVKT